MYNYVEQNMVKNINFFMLYIIKILCRDQTSLSIQNAALV